MAIQFTITDTRNPEENFTRAFVQNKITIGRARHCDICLPDLSVSTSHAEIRFYNNDYHLVDNGSLNGTWCGEKKLVAHRPRRLSNGDLFCVSSFQITFQVNAAIATKTERNLSQKQALKMLGAVLAMRPSAPPPEPDLKQIQNAPEEETASFCTNVSQVIPSTDPIPETPNTDQNLPPGDDTCLPLSVARQDNADASKATASAVASIDASENADTRHGDVPLPTGPEDPLAPTEVPIPERPLRPTAPPSRKKSDLGLIVVGAIIVITCVVALIRLLA